MTGEPGLARGRVVLVGAGPGAPDLITIRGVASLRRADVVVHDSLAPQEVLAIAPPSAERIDVGKRGHEEQAGTQDEINALLVSLAQRGLRVVRLKGGDPFVFGRGGEEASACRAAGIPFEVVPGVTSAVAAAAAAGIPVTDRRHAASFAVVTGHADPTRPLGGVRWDRLAAGADTLVVLMGMRNLEKIVAALLEHGRPADTPAAVVMEGATARQRVVEAPLAELPERVRAAGLQAPAVIVVGDVVRLRADLAWYDASPLFGRRVLVTRAADQALGLLGALRAAGAETVHVPMIRTEPAGEPGPIEDPGPSAYDAVVFTSANAVRFFADRLRARGGDPAALAPAVWCVGPATAEAAREVGLPEPKLPADHFDAEGLVDAIARSGPPAGSRFLFVRGDQARSVVPRGLRELGAVVDAAVVYRTAPAHFDEADLRRRLVAGELDVLTFASPSTVRRFADCLDEPARRAAQGCVVAAIGGVTAAALRSNGLEPDVVPARAGAMELVDALHAHLAGKSPRGGL